MTKYHCDNCGHVQDASLSKVGGTINGSHDTMRVLGFKLNYIELCIKCLDVIAPAVRDALERAKTANVIHRAAGKS